jgi:hypothetical protein
MGIRGEHLPWGVIKAQALLTLCDLTMPKFGIAVKRGRTALVYPTLRNKQITKQRFLAGQKEGPDRYVPVAIACID